MPPAPSLPCVVCSISASISFKPSWFRKFFIPLLFLVCQSPSLLSKADLALYIWDSTLSLALEALGMPPPKVQSRPSLTCSPPAHILEYVWSLMMISLSLLQVQLSIASPPCHPSPPHQNGVSPFSPMRAC